MNKDMTQWSTEQLQAALKELYTRNGDLHLCAYQLCFDELLCRMGEEAFDSWFDNIMNAEHISDNVVTLTGKQLV